MIPPALIALIGPVLNALGPIGQYLNARLGYQNTPEMKVADEAKKNQQAQDKINKAIVERDEKATRDGLA